MICVIIYISVPFNLIEHNIGKHFWNRDPHETLFNWNLIDSRMHLSILDQRIIKYQKRKILTASFHFTNNKIISSRKC